MTQDCSAKIVTTQEEQTDLLQLDGLIIKSGKSQRPIKWFRNQFNQICGFEPNQEQIEPPLSDDEQSFVPDIIDQLQTMIRNHMADALIEHRANQKIEWKQTIDLQRMVNAMSFTHPNHSNGWKSLRNPDQFNAFAKHFTKSPTTPVSLVRSSSVCPITASSNLDFPTLDNLTLDRPECRSQDQAADGVSIPSVICSQDSHKSQKSARLKCSQSGRKSESHSQNSGRSCASSRHSRRTSSSARHSRKSDFSS